MQESAELQVTITSQLLVNAGCDMNIAYIYIYKRADH